MKNVTAEELHEMMMEQKEREKKMKKMYRQQRILNQAREKINE